MTAPRSLGSRPKITKCQVVVKGKLAVKRQRRHRPMKSRTSSGPWQSVPFYVSDYTPVREAADWKPRRALSIVLEDVRRWLVDHRDELEPVLR